MLFTTPLPPITTTATMIFLFTHVDRETWRVPSARQASQAGYRPTEKRRAFHQFSSKSFLSSRTVHDLEKQTTRFQVSR